MTADAATPRGATTIGRQAWIDWLKVLVVIGVFVYHAAQPFVLTTWIVVGEEKSVVLSAIAGLGCRGEATDGETGDQDYPHV